MHRDGGDIGQRCSFARAGKDAGDAGRLGSADTELAREAGRCACR